MPFTRVFALAALMAASLALSGCGKKGNPELPEGAPTRTVIRADGTKEKLPAKPSRPFVLDGLLN